MNYCSTARRIEGARDAGIRGLMGRRAEVPCSARAWGNGMAERHHRTIKVMATRQCRTVLGAINRYSSTPEHGRDVTTAPLQGIYRRARRDPYTLVQGGTNPFPQPAHHSGVFQVGDAVWARKRGGHEPWLSPEKARSGRCPVARPDHSASHVVGVDATTGSAINGNDEEHADDDVACPVPPVTDTRAADLRGPDDNTI